MQGDTLKTAFHGIGINQLIELLQKPNFAQKWFADVGSAAGDLEIILAELEKLDVRGKVFGYKPSKCQIRKKENHQECFIEVFEGTNITMAHGFRILPLQW